MDFLIVSSPPLTLDPEDIAIQETKIDHEHDHE